MRITTCGSEARLQCWVSCVGLENSLIFSTGLTLGIVMRPRIPPLPVCVWVCFPYATKVLSEGTFLVVLWLRFCLLVQGMWVQSLVRELRFHISCAAPRKIKQNIRQKQCCNKFHKDFKSGLHFKKSFKK